jgi:tetratricopeptide (TPR) repeat protein/DNA-binding XRE family transcriptional regulator
MYIREENKKMSPNQALRQARIERHWTKQDVADHMGIPWQTIALWEQGTALPDNSLRQQLCTLFGKTAQELGLPTQESGLLTQETSNISSPCWFMPLPRNRFFTGREAHLQALHNHFQLPGDETQPRVQAICGVGGIGKTQIALEYAYRFRDDYAAVIWLRTQTPETLIADLRALMDAFDLPEKQYRLHHQIFSAVKRWLKEHSNWLLILDNVEEFALVREFLAPPCVGHVLLTTRRQGTSASWHCLNLQPWSSEEGVLFLLHRAGLLPQQAPLASAADELRRQATGIFQELGGLPLALDQAGAYLEETGCTLPGYQQRFQEHSALLLSRRGLEHFAHPDPVTTTILLVLERVEHQLPAAAELLRLCSFLACDAIPEELITGQSAEILGPVLYASANDPLALDSMYATVRSTSLMQLNVQTRLLSIHRLVQMVIITHMDKETQQLWARRAFLAVNRAFPVMGKERGAATLPRTDLLLPHALFTLTNIDRFLQEEEQSSMAHEISGLQHKVGTYLIARGYYQKAQPILERCLSLCEQTLGSTHPDVAELLARLGYLLLIQGRHGSAKALLEQALAIYEQASLSVSPFLNSVLTNLAMISLDRGHYQQAEVLMKREMYIQEVLQEKDGIGSSLTNLAIVYQRQGRYEEARALWLHALRLYEQNLEHKPHDLSLAVLNNLINFYTEQGKYAETEPFRLQALHLKEQVQGLDIPLIAMMLRYLGDLSRKQGRFEEAESQYIGALDLWEQTAGSGHLLTAYALHGLALLRMAQGQQQEAEQLLHQTIQIREQAYDEPHADLAEALHDLALLYSRQGKEEVAELLFERALRIREQILGPGHPALATSLHDLGLLYTKQGRKDKARSYLQRALALREQALGKRHPETRATRSCLEALQATSDERSVRIPSALTGENSSR